MARYALLAGRAQFVVEVGESALSLKMRSRLKNPAKGYIHKDEVHVAVLYSTRNPEQPGVVYVWTFVGIDGTGKWRKIGDIQNGVRVVWTTNPKLQESSACRQVRTHDA